MSRIRSYRPNIWEWDEFTALPETAQLLMLRMMSHADDNGRLKASPTFMHGKLYPNEDLELGDFLAAFADLCDQGFATVYHVGKKRYVQLLWGDPALPIYQVIQRPSGSNIPPPQSNPNEPLNEGLNEPLTQHGLSDSIGTDGGTEGPPSGPDVPSVVPADADPAPALGRGQAGPAPSRSGEFRKSEREQLLDDLEQARATGNAEMERYCKTRLQSKGWAYPPREGAA